MCGLVGLMTEKIMLSDHLKFKDLMVLAQLRGEEGSGLIAIPKTQVETFPPVKRSEVRHAVAKASAAISSASAASGRRRWR